MDDKVTRKTATHLLDGKKTGFWYQAREGPFQRFTHLETDSYGFGLWPP